MQINERLSIKKNFNKKLQHTMFGVETKAIENWVGKLFNMFEYLDIFFLLPSIHFSLGDL